VQGGSLQQGCEIGRDFGFKDGPVERAHPRDGQVERAQDFGGQGFVMKACYEERGVAMGDALRAANEDVGRAPLFSDEFWAFYGGRPRMSSEPGCFEEQKASIWESLRQKSEIQARASS